MPFHSPRNRSSGGFSCFRPGCNARLSFAVRQPCPVDLSIRPSFPCVRCPVRRVLPAPFVCGLLCPACPVCGLHVCRVPSAGALCCEGFSCLSRPEKGLQKRVNLMQQTTNSDLSRHYLPRQLRHLILQEYLSGVKTARQLSEEHGIPMSTIHKMGQRWKAKNSCSFVSTPNPYPIMSRVTSEEASELLSENKALRRRLEEALLRLEGYEIMGDILQEEYGIDLLKKSAAGQSSVSKKDTQQ